MTELPKIRSGILSRGDLRGMAECESLGLLVEVVVNAGQDRSRDGFMHAVRLQVACKRTFEDGAAEVVTHLQQRIFSFRLPCERVWKGKPTRVFLLAFLFLR